MRFGSLFFLLLAAVLMQRTTQADLLGYWSANSTEGQGVALPNDQGNRDLDGELVEASYSADGQGHTGQEGDYAIEFEGFDEDYAVIPPTDEEFEEITITAWVNGLQQGAWAGLVVSRAPGQPIGLDYHAFDGTLSYIWNDDSAETWGFISDVFVPEDEWAFVALTITEDAANLYAGPKGGELEFATNEILHTPQLNFHEWRLAEDDCCGTERNFAGLMDDISIWNEALTLDQLTELFNGDKTPLTLVNGNTIAGDFDGSGQRDPADLDLLAEAMAADDVSFDLDGDGDVDYEDRRFWVEQLSNTFVGDSNFDGEFNSSDFVAVFTAAKYETAEPATWAEGDWNGDGKFDSSDFVVAFQGQGYEQGEREGGLMVVPEPSSGMLVVLGLFAVGLPVNYRRSNYRR